MMPPQVQTLDQLMSATNPIYAPQRQNITDQIGQTQDAGQAEEQGLYGTQQNAFRDIAQMASNKGMLFSGFTPDQQAQYNATKFMPALTGLHAKVADNIARLQSALIGLDTDQRKGAMSEQANQQTQVTDFNKTQDQRDYDEQVRREAYQNELKKIQYQSSLTPPKPLAPAEVQRQDAGALYQQLQQVAGSDGFISPEDYARGLQLWQSAGYDHKSYDATFSGLRNLNNPRYRLATGWGA